MVGQFENRAKEKLNIADKNTETHFWGNFARKSKTTNKEELWKM